ncbi:DUF6702 family protein [Anditalea andensis]|uniref:Uncharacterized protein n=1 Tax=Anditalea andensis TaxID=1048983 RepID=A0A074KT84_9BACT|nr:DUF6702 family protein [Anditalea andensis]KEO73156.1 hypothetical protein EL17_12415 [Anditalea andensis]
MHHHYIFTIILGWMAIFHPFYISLTEAKYNEQSGSFEISQKIFWDDFESVLSGESGKKLNFLNPADQQELDAMVEKYLLLHNLLYVNGKEVKLKYLGYEVEEDAAWFYFQSEKVKFPYEVGMKNTVFLKQFENQQHVVNLYVGKNPKTLMLDRKKNFGKVKFN